MLDLTTMHWPSLSPTEKRDLVKKYADQNKSAGQIARILGVSRNAVVGVVHRNRQHITLSGGPGWGTTNARRRARREPRHTNEPKLARLGPPKSSTKTSATAQERAVSGPAWRPLEGSTPVDLISRTGCAWPVNVDGKTLFCDCAKAPDTKLPYCPTHLARYGRLK